MRTTYNALMQSKFYSSAFNTAIFDGPLRIYFAQFHEATALKLYFAIQQQLAPELAKAKERSKVSHANVMIMMYPTEESFLLSFEGHHNHNWEVELWNQDAVIGLRGPIEESEVDLFIANFKNLLEEWTPQATVRPTPMLEA